MHPYRFFPAFPFDLLAEQRDAQCIFQACLLAYKTPMICRGYQHLPSSWKRYENKKKVRYKKNTLRPRCQQLLCVAAILGFQPGSHSASEQGHDSNLSLSAHNLAQ